MTRVNENYLKLPGSYLFSTIGKKRKAYAEAHPDSNIISLGIGDVTQPLAPAIITALHKAVDEMANAETFHGYAPDLGYELQRTIIRIMAVRFMRMKFLFPMEQNVTVVIFRKFSVQMQRLQCVIRYILFMWTPM